VSESVLEALATHGFGRVDLDDLIRFAESGLCAEDVFALPNGCSIETLIELHEHGMDAETAQAVLRVFPAIDAATLLAFADQGVDADDAAEFVAYDASLTARDILRLADAGVEPEFVGALAAHGYTSLGVDRLLALHEAGFTP